ncbi:MAG: hypothetical protein ACRC42_00600 [Mycoplasma sp.]
MFCLDVFWFVILAIHVSVASFTLVQTPLPLEITAAKEIVKVIGTLTGVVARLEG